MFPPAATISSAGTTPFAAVREIDLLVGGFGSNQLFGDGGFDKAGLQPQLHGAVQLAAPVLIVSSVINLVTQRATVTVSGENEFGDPFGFVAVNDTISGIENIDGTSGNDSIVGDDFGNNLFGSRRERHHPGRRRPGPDLGRRRLGCSGRRSSGRPARLWGGDRPGEHRSAWEQWRQRLRERRQRGLSTR